MPPVRLHTLAGQPDRVRGVSVHDRRAAAERWGTPLLFGPGSFLVAHTAEEHLELAELEAAIGHYVGWPRRACGTRPRYGRSPLTHQVRRVLCCWMIPVVKTCACCCVRANVPVAAEVLLGEDANK